MKLIGVILLIASLILNAVLLLRHFHIPSGGGISETSPNSQYVADLQSLMEHNGMAANAHEIYAVASIRKNAIQAENVIEFRISPIAAASEMDYRRLEKPVVWSGDGKHVTFTTPEYTIIYNLEPRAPSPSQNEAPQSQSSTD